MINQLTVSFQLKRNRPNEMGKVPVYVRITINSARTEFSIKKRVIPDRWHKRAGKAIGNTEDARTLNTYLIKVESKLRQMYERHCDLNESISPSVYYFFVFFFAHSAV